VNDPFVGSIDVRLWHILSPDEVIEAAVDIEYEDPDTGYRRKLREQFAAPEELTAGRDVTIPTPPNGTGRFTYGLRDHGLRPRRPADRGAARAQHRGQADRADTPALTVHVAHFIALPNARQRSTTSSSRAENARGGRNALPALGSGSSR
jgi:hypothetical protein